MNKKNKMNITKVFIILLFCELVIQCNRNNIRASDQKMIVPSFAKNITRFTSERIKGEIVKFEVYSKYLSKEVLNFYDSQLCGLGFIKIEPQSSAWSKGDWNFLSPQPGAPFNHVTIDVFWFNYSNLQLYWINLFYEGDIDKLAKSTQLEKQNVVVNLLQVNKTEFEKIKNVLETSPSDLFFQNEGG